MKAQKPTFILLVLGLLLIGAYSCNYYIDHSFRKNYSDVNEALRQDTTGIPFFKVHYTNGDVAFLEEWNLNPAQDTLFGQGRVFDFNRAVGRSGMIGIPVEEIAIVETNQLNAIRSKDNGRMTAIAVVAGVNAIGGILCLTNPKACFGSCPTFYLDGPQPLQAAVAEGFSSSVAPSLEKKDIDDLGFSAPAGPFGLTMKNEALETHMVNQLELLAIPKPADQQVYFDSEGKFYRGDSPITPATARAGKKDIAPLLSEMDHQEYFSVTDSFDLFAEEEVILEFDDLPPDRLGAVIHFRQTLLTTYIFYSLLSYAGNEVGHFYTNLETDPNLQELFSSTHDRIETNLTSSRRLDSPFSRLGSISVQYWDEGERRWVPAGSVHESGPIAINRSLIALPEELKGRKQLRLKVIMAKGLWRLDYLGLASIKEAAQPLEIQLEGIEVIDGREQKTADVHAVDNAYLIAFPGNAYRLDFNLPETTPGKDYALFLSSQGYYLEWMREAWLKEKNIPKLKKMLSGDPGFWRDFALSYKAEEAGMDSVFWNSKYEGIQ